jgi:hypothetical protein
MPPFCFLLPGQLTAIVRRDPILIVPAWIMKHSPPGQALMPRARTPPNLTGWRTSRSAKSLFASFSSEKEGSFFHSKQTH